jgi:hypothetical protein
VHSIAIQVPISELTRDGWPASTDDPRLGDRRVDDREPPARSRRSGRRSGARTSTAARSQVSRLGNPLFNEVLIPLGRRTCGTRRPRPTTSSSRPTSPTPSWPGCCPRSTRACSRTWPRSTPGTARADLEAILLTGIPAGIVPGFQNYTGPVQADMLRLNTAIKPTVSKPNILGLIGGDLAGFPNGRRVFDDVVTIELRAIAGVTYPLVDPTYTPDAAAGLVTDGLTARQLHDLERPPNPASHSGDHRRQDHPPPVLRHVAEPIAVADR